MKISSTYNVMWCAKLWLLVIFVMKDLSMSAHHMWGLERKTLESGNLPDGAKQLLVCLVRILRERLNESLTNDSLLDEHATINDHSTYVTHCTDGAARRIRICARLIVLTATEWDLCFGGCELWSKLLFRYNFTYNIGWSRLGLYKSSRHLRTLYTPVQVILWIYDQHDKVSMVRDKTHENMANLSYMEAGLSPETLKEIRTGTSTVIETSSWSR